MIFFGRRISNAAGSCAAFSSTLTFYLKRGDSNEVSDESAALCENFGSNYLIAEGYFETGAGGAGVN